MTNSQRLATIRNRLLTWIAASNDDHRVEQIVRETVLIRDDFFVGRRFYTDSHSAVWFIEEDKLKVFDAEQRLLCVLATAEIDAADTEPAVADQESSEPAVIKMPSPRERGADADPGIRRAA